MLNYLAKLEKRKAIGFINSEIKRLEYIKKIGVNVDWRDLHHVKPLCLHTPNPHG